MATKLTDGERAAIVEGLRAGKSVRQVADETGRGVASVSRVAAQSGLELDRSDVKKAADAHLANSRARLAELASGLIDDAFRLREGLFKQMPGEPSAHQKAQVMVAIGIAMQRSGEIVHAAAPGVDEAKGLVRELLDGVSEWAHSE